MSDAIERSYDAVPYEGATFAQTHPDRLAMVARLYGLQAPLVATCRVLELGCASGENLIPMAYALPEATFLGTDLSGRQIAAGQALIADLGLKNIRLEHTNILDIDATFGQFDYIICHGVYSWVPEVVRDKILGVIHTNLAPEGVAQVSYNTYPGWHHKAMVREIMRYHAGQFDDPAQKIAQARAALDFVAASVFESNTYYGAWLKEAAEDMHRAKDTYLYHEFLEDVNRPLWFHQFWDQLAGKQLDYLGDAYLASGTPLQMKEETRQGLAAVAGDYCRYEQFLDFLRDRTFRHSLVIHAGRGVQRRPVLEAMATFHVGGKLTATQGTEADIASDRSMSFVDLRNKSMTTNHPLLKAALWEIGAAWPGVLEMPTLFARVRERLGGHVPPEMIGDPHALWVLLLQVAWSRSVDLHVHPPRCAAALSARPEASAVARRLSRVSEHLPNLRHHEMHIDGLPREVLVRLDGTRDLPTLTREIIAEAQAGRLKIDRDGQVLTGDAMVASVTEAVPQIALELLRKSLLVR